MVDPYKEYLTQDDDFSASLYQRTEELNQIDNARPDPEGRIRLRAIVLDHTIILPNMVSPLFIHPGSDLLAIQKAQENNETNIGVIPDEKAGFMEICLELAVGRLLELPDGNYSALVQGRRRLKVDQILETDNLTSIQAIILEQKTTPLDNHLRALMKTARLLFEQVVQLDSAIPEEAHLFSMNIDDPGWLADMIATAISPSNEQRKEIIATIDEKERLAYLNQLLAEELDVLELEEEIQSRVQKEVDRGQREVYLREQIRAIQVELGEGDLWEQEIREYQDRLEKGGFPENVKRTIQAEIKKLSLNPVLSPESGIIRNYIDWLVSLPWEIKSEDNLSIRHAEKVLKKNHYGLNKAKERILEYLAVRSLQTNHIRQPVLCFIGPPGTGKSSLGRSIAEALGRKFARISLGGIRDEAEIRGHRRTYISALPGRIIQTIKIAGTRNPLFMLDEIDKLGFDYRGDPSSALLEVLDQEQNSEFSDHYLELPFDLSDVLFITTANSIDNIPPALLDRLEMIEFPGYIEEEKTEIAKHFLIIKQLLENGLAKGETRFKDEVIIRIIREYTYEAGVRNLEREIGRICRKIAKLKSLNKKVPEVIEPDMLEKFLGPPQFFSFDAESDDGVGVSTAIAWTENGGEIMPVEVLIMEGKGNLQITGKVGDMMQESAQAALSYIKSRSEEFDIDLDVYEKIDIHLHIPEGAIEKDGPSAGITICTAMISALTKRKVHMDIGMTGELTLRGRILQVGGLKEKIYAARRAGLKKIIIPKKNEKDLAEIPSKVKKELKIVCVDHMDQVFKLALYP
jgi:ATP-dependent Lon protease